MRGLPTWPSRTPGARGQGDEQRPISSVPGQIDGHGPRDASAVDHRRRPQDRRQAHTNPVLYLEDDGKYVVTGSGAGSAEEPQWFKNLRRTDQAEIEVGRRHLPVSVEITDGAEREVLWQRLLVRAPFFADYQKKVERQIPMAVLTPMT
jgi:deazaflavin-dependent oxidoreductase (nitroreductase family)